MSLKSTISRYIRRTIATDLVVGLTLTIVAVMVLIGVWNYYITTSQIRKELNGRAIHIAKKLTGGLALHVWNIDEDAIAEFIRMCPEPKDIIATRIYSEYNDLIYEHTFQERFYDYTIYRESIIHNDRIIGFLEVELSGEGVVKAGHSIVYSTLIIIVCVITAVIIVTRFLLDKLLGSSMRKLTENIGIIANGNYQHRLGLTKYEDINTIHSEVNTMAGQIANRTERLQSEIVEREQAELKLRSTHEKLVESSRHAGMAEVAAGVLHNVGNVLNSINVSTILISEKIAKSRMPNFVKIADIIDEHSDDIAAFFTEDPRGKHVPTYLIEMAKLLSSEQDEMSKEMDSLTKNIKHIKEIINTQQSYAKTSEVKTRTDIRELVENAIQIDLAGLKKRNIKVKCNFDDLEKVIVDKQRVLQILVNLISNSKYALDESDRKNKLLTIRCYKYDEDWLRIVVIDNGIGIARENLMNIFRHGFTTREDGHGFGLHSSALSAKQLGGQLIAESDGPDKGAEFTLEIPYQPAEIFS